jgi:D-serine deaminase-like pyridoxal phosphate-dependent protein
MTADWPSLSDARALIGQQGSRFAVPTPALVVDLDALERNIARMAARAKAAGLALRPHAKTHKSAAIAARQIAAGAVGQCCAKLGEAEALAAAGVRGFLITSPVVGAGPWARAAALAKVDPGLMLTVDHPDQVDGLAAAAAKAGVTLSLVIDVDVGLGRTGVARADEAAALAARIGAADSLGLKGLQGYGGHWQHRPGADKRRAMVVEGMQRLTAAIEAVRAAGFATALATGGGTGTAEADGELGVLNELQAGSYVFMDRQYRDALGEDPDGVFEHSLFIQAQVISANAPGWVTIDAGLKAMSTEGPMPTAVGERFGDCAFAFFGDEHGRLTRPAGDPVRIGERVELIAPHCDPTVDRYDFMYFVRGDALVEIAPIDAARRSQ